MDKIIKKIKKMDVKSDEFWEIYQFVRKKYWTMPEKDQDDFYRSASILNSLSHIDDTELVIGCGKVVNEVVHALKDGSARSGQIGFTKDKCLYFRISLNPDQMDNMQTLIRKAVIVQNKEDS